MFWFKTLVWISSSRRIKVTMDNNHQSYTLTFSTLVKLELIDEMLRQSDFKAVVFVGAPPGEEVMARVVAQRETAGSVWCNLWTHTHAHTYASGNVSQYIITFGEFFLQDGC